MFADLSDAAWTRRESLTGLVAALGADNIRWVGGAIRDSLLGVEVNDVDCATLLLPDEVVRRCNEAGIRTVPTGIEHGTVTAILKGGPVDHHAAPRRFNRWSPGDYCLRRKVGRGCRTARFHHQCALCPS